MKTKTEILENLIQYNDSKIFDIIDQITEELNKCVIQGIDTYEYVFMHGDYKNAENISYRVAAQLKALGFHVRLSWRETWAGGNERPVIQVSFQNISPRDAPIYLRANFWIGCLCAVAVVLIVFAMDLWVNTPDTWSDTPPDVEENYIQRDETQDILWDTVCN